MENGGRAEAHLAIVAVKESNHMHAGDDIDWCVSRMDCDCYGYFQNYYPMIPNCHQGTAVSQIGRMMVPYSLSPVQIRSLHNSGKYRLWKTEYRSNM